MLRELALFAGAGGGLLGSELLGWRTVCACEIDPYCRRVLLARQRDGFLPRFPIWDDVRTFDGRPWRGSVDVVSGGFPCQDVSTAGRKRGIEGDRSALWLEMLRVVTEVRPRYVFAENSPNLRKRGLEDVLEGLTALGYRVAWGTLGARHVGAPHRRDRLWIVADSDSREERRLPTDPRSGVARVSSEHEGERGPGATDRGSEPDRDLGWSRDPFAGVRRVRHGVAHGLDRNRAAGNGQVPAVAALAWETLRCSLN